MADSILRSALANIADQVNAAKCAIEDAISDASALPAGKRWDAARPGFDAATSQLAEATAMLDTLAK